MPQSISTNTFGVAKYVVSTDPTQGTHTTISDASAVAVSGDTIWIRDGIYVENLTLVPGVAYVGESASTFASLNTRINGTLSMTTAGTASLAGLFIVGQGSNSALEITGSADSVVQAINCRFQAPGTGGTATINITSTGVADCSLINGQVFSGGGAGRALSISGTTGTSSFTEVNFFVNGTLSNMITSGGLALSRIVGGAVSFDISSAVGFSMSDSVVGSLGYGVSPLIFSSADVYPAEGDISNCTFSTDSSVPCISCAATSGVFVNRCTFNQFSGNVLGGTGSLSYSLLSFGAASSEIDPALTLVPVTVRLGTYNILTSVTNAMSPYTVLSSDQYLSVDSTAGVVTLRFPNTPNIGQVWTIKDAAGTAATNNITITTVSGTDLIDGATTYVINSSYQSANIIATSSTTYSIY